MPPGRGHGPGGHGPGGFGGGYGGGVFFTPRGFIPGGNRYSQGGSANPGVAGGKGAEGIEYDDFYALNAPDTIRVNVQKASQVLHNQEHGYALYKTHEELKKEGKETKIRFGTKVKGFFLGLGRSLSNPFAKLRFDWSCESTYKRKEQLLKELPYEVKTTEDYNHAKAAIEKDFNLQLFTNHERRLRRAHKYGYISMEQYNEKMQEYIEKYHIEASDYTRSHWFLK